MNRFTSLITARRSTRKFTPEPLSAEQAELILKAALMAPTSKSSFSWQFVAVEDKPTLKRLAGCKSVGAAFIEQCALAVVVAGDRTKSDVWIEDASVASIYMQLQAEDLGLGSCWCQVRGRSAGDGADAEQQVRDWLGIPDTFGILSIIGFGHKDQVRKPFDEAHLLWENVHADRW
ncbi:MAG: nitroreductase family protein [Tannerella sp.]|jgi:nitroreductase|nr:nitroreductase family protein [Tannerella sp.]